MPKTALVFLYSLLVCIFTGEHALSQLESAKREWQRLATESPGVHCVVRTDYGSRDQPGVSYEFFVSEDSICQIASYADGRQRVACRNSVYAFELSRDSKSSNWGLKNLFQLKDANYRTAPLKGIALPQVSIVPQDLDWTVRQPLFQLDPSSSIDLFEFKCESAYHDRRSRTEVSLQCDRTRRFAVTEWSGKIIAESDQGDVRGKVTYSDKSIDNWPVPLHCELVISSSSEPPSVWRYFYDKWDFTAVPREQFRLEGFGLQEPDFGDEGSGVWNYYVFGAVIFCLLIGVLWKRRRESP